MGSTPAQSRRYYLKNRDKVLIKNAMYQVANPEKIKVIKRQWDKANRKQKSEYARKRCNERYASELSFRMLCILRQHVRNAIRRQPKSSSTRQLLGCSVPDFIIYLESRFEPGMTWENYGKTWEVDHIMPCVLFDLLKPEHQKRCFHFSNLRPLSVTENRARYWREK